MEESSMHRRKIRRAAGICLAALVAILLTGCGKTGVFDGSRTTNEAGFQMEYSVLNREETAEIELSEGERLQVQLAHDKGNVDVTIGQKDKEPIYRGTKQENAGFILTIPESGAYSVTVTGHQAKGRVSFTRIPAEAE